MCGICVHFSWLDCSLLKLYILQIYHIMPLIDVYEIFSQNHMYFLMGSYFAQNLKRSLLSLLLNLEAQYGTQSWTQSGATKTKGIADLVYIEKSYKCYKFLHFQACIFQDQPWNLPDFMDEICQISSWNLPDFMKFTWFREIHWISPWNPPDFTIKSARFYE